MKADPRSMRPPPRFAPTEDWIKAFEAEYTQLMIMNVIRYARARARHVGTATSSYAEDLVQNIASDTVQGVLSWNPKRKALEQHLRDAVKVRTHHDRKRASRFTHQPIDPSTTEGRATISEVDEALLGRASDVDALHSAEVDARELLELAKDDAGVLAIVQARIDGASSKREVIRASGLSSSEYHNARRRLVTYLEQLSSRRQPRRDRMA